MDKINKFQNFISNISNLPIWIKSVLYIHLKEHLEADLTKEFFDQMSYNDFFQFYKPKITERGINELQTKAFNLHTNLYKFLDDSKQGLSIIEMIVNNAWTLEEASSSFTEAVEFNFIDQPKSIRMFGFAQLMCSKIRMGEFFVITNKITELQLAEALTQQQQIKETTGKKLGIATILLNLGFVDKTDVQVLLKLKEESQKKFALNLSYDAINLDEEINKEETNGLKENISRLQKENKILKDQFKKILNLTQS